MNELNYVETIHGIDPKEAASNINNANLFGISPDTYVDVKPHMDIDAETYSRIPANIESEVSEYTNQSKQHAALAANDLENMNLASKFLKYAGDVFSMGDFAKEAGDSYNFDIQKAEGMSDEEYIESIRNDKNEFSTFLESSYEKVFTLGDLNKEKVDWYTKKMENGGVLEPHEAEYLQGLNQDIADREQNITESNSAGTKLVIDSLGGVGDIVRSYTENLGLIGLSAGTVATVGAGAGAFGGPGLAGIGAVAGGLTGLIGGITLAGFKHGFRNTKALTYAELDAAANDQGEPLNIDEATKTSVSYGVAIVSGAMEAFSNFTLAKANPMFQRFVGAKQSAKLAAKYLTSSPQVMAKMKILGGIAKSVFTEGGEEGLQELVQIIGVNFAKIDANEASFTNALNTAIDSLPTGQKIFATIGRLGMKAKQAVSESANVETLKQAGYSATVGGLTGGIFTGTTGLAGYKGLAQRYEKAQRLQKSGEQALINQNKMLNTVAALKSTEMQNLSPDEVDSFIDKIYQKTVGQDTWLYIEDMQKFAGDDVNKQELLTKFLGLPEDLVNLTNELNGPYRIDEKSALKIAMQEPSFTEYMRLHPEGNTPIEVRTNAQEQAARLEAAESKRQELVSGLGEDQVLTPEMELEIANTLFPETTVEEEGILNEQDFYESAKLDLEPVDKALSQEEIDNLNNIELDARLGLAKVINEKVDRKFERIEQRATNQLDASELSKEIEAFSTEHSIINNFAIKDEKSEAGKLLTQNHKRKNYSPVSIDPASLPETLRRKYFRKDKKGNYTTETTDPVLKRRKAFVNGGIPLEESAALLGLDSGEQLLQILAETPSRSQIIKARRQKKLDARNRIHQVLELARNNARDEAFSKVTNVNLKIMDFMKSKKWPTVKRGVIKIAGQTPTVEGLNRKAKAFLANVQLKEIYPRRYKSGYNKSKRLALQSWLKGDVEQAYKLFEAAALNNELYKESLYIRDKIKKYNRFWKNIQKPATQQLLSDAGLSKVMDEYTDVFRLTTDTKGLSELESFNKFIETQASEGKYVPVIPDRLNDVRESARELTTEQYFKIGEMGEHILHEARLKNKFLKAQEQREELRTAEKIAKRLEEQALAHPLYNKKNLTEKKRSYLNESETYKAAVGTAVSTFSNMKNIIYEFDNFTPDGYLHQQIGLPIKEAFNGKRGELKEIADYDFKTVEAYGTDKFKRAFHESITIPELADVRTLGDGDGSIRKIDLMYLFAHMGDPDARQALTTFKNVDGENISLETFQEIFERELDEADAAFVQSFMIDRYKRFTERSFDLHKKTTGIEPEMVVGVPIKHRGKTLPGGYVPIKRQRVPDADKVRTWLEKLINLPSDIKEAFTNEDNHFFAKLRAAEMTKQDRLKQRTGSDRPLDIDFDNIFNFTEEIVHDLHFRETGIDALKILKNPLNVDSIKGVVGPKKFANLLNSVKDVISKTSEQESVLHSDEYRAFNDFVRKVHSLHAIKAIGYNLRSAMIQPDSLKNVAIRLGPKATLYLSKAAKRMADNPLLMEHYAMNAAKINPDIAFEQDGIDTAVTKHSYDWVPSKFFFDKYNSKAGAARIKIGDWQKKIIDSSFYFVREGDRVNRIITTYAVSEMFLNGDIEGYSLDVINKMTEKEKAEKMHSISQQVIDLTLTATSQADRTPLEKFKAAKMLLRYWVDRRSYLNTAVHQMQRTGIAVKQKDYAKAAKLMGTTALATGISAAWMNAIRMEYKEIAKKFRIKDEEDAQELAADTVFHFLTSPFVQFAEVIPVLDNIKFAYDLDLRSDYRNVSTPFLGVASDVAIGAGALRDVLKTFRKTLTKGKWKNVNLSEVQRKSMLTNLGYLSGLVTGQSGLPTNSIINIAEGLQSKNVKKLRNFVIDQARDLKREIELFSDAMSEVPEAKTLISDLNEYANDFLPPTDQPKKLIPDDAKEVIKQISSKGEWDAYDPETGAAGIYQFTEDRWNEIANTQPQLSLTENGRVSKNTTQQEKAMQWELEDSAAGLSTFDIPVNNETLYGSHLLGVENYIQIYGANDSDKLSTVLGEDAQIDVLLKRFGTVKAVKLYIRRKLKAIDNQ